MIINVVENPIIEDLKITGVKNKKLLKYLEDQFSLKIENHSLSLKLVVI